MKKISLPLTFILIGINSIYSQTVSQLYSKTNKVSYLAGYSSINFSKYNNANFINYKNASAINLGINYRIFEKKNHQLTTGAIINYSKLEYRINNNFTDAGTELFLEIPVKFEYNIPLNDNFYITPKAGLNFSTFLNSEQRYYQNYFYQGGSYETTIQTQPLSLGGIINVEINYKTPKGVFGLNAGYSTTLNNVYHIDHINVDSDFWFSQSLKRKYLTVGLKFTPNK